MEAGKEGNHDYRVTIITALRRSHTGLRALLQCGAVSERNTPTLDGYPISILKILHRARDGLTAGTNHLCDGLMRERLDDRGTSGLLGQIEQQTRDTSRNVE